jgi:UDP-N-acetyl-D-mannosaminuronic acid transferase (WecB/TagA/CpsF family)
MSTATETILGVEFHIGTTEEAIEAALTGGLVLAPSGPGLAGDFIASAAYREALLAAEVNLTDSGFMLLLWRWRTGRRLPRLSGLGYLQALLARPEARAARGTFWVMPSAAEQAVNLAWLRAQGVEVTEADCYLAPFYGPGGIGDDVLLERIRARRPRVVMLAIGGGVQERLGLGLRRALEREPERPGVVCIGAAIAFLSGTQAKVPSWADRWMLGWLCRIVAEPGRYLPRYWRARRLAGLVFRHGEKLPPPAGRDA